MGGKSTRLGRDKAWENFGAGSLLQRVLSRLVLLKSDIILVTGNSNNQTLKEVPEFPGLRIVTDIYPGKGPLGGIYSGLVSSVTQYNLVVACDMPFLNLDLIRYMTKLAPEYDIVIPRVGKWFESLHAIYSRDCLASVKSMLEAGTLAISELFPRVRVRYVESEEIDRFDPLHLSFFNINTEADLLKAKELMSSGKY